MIRFAENLNKMIAAGLGGALEAPRTEVAVGHRIVYTEASGAVVNFETNLIAPVKNLRVTMEPIQDLHGQNAPYPAGGGKNLMPPPISITQSSRGTATNDNGVLTITTDGAAAVFEIYIPSFTFAESGQKIELLNSFTDATIYFFNGSTQVDYFSLTTKNRVINSASMTALLGETIDRYRLRINAHSLTGATFGLMVTPESDTALSAFSPYSNICPITGRESVTVWREASYNPSADPALTIQLGDTIYGGTLDVSTGKLTVTHGEIASYNGEVLTGEWISDRDVYAAGTTPTIGAQVVYVLDTPQTIDLDPQQIATLIGDNNVWSDAGNISLEYPYYEETEGY